MSSKHTPGPWTLGRHYIVTDGGLIVFSAGIADGLAELRVMNDADARLIVAAPALLEALETILASRHLTIDHEANRTPEALALRDKARAALDLAKGTTEP